mmetsp:Transcript_204/g.427  ORF Transcript_204/g.427 Transcript_204/m.427 type:complete len:631 (+) Transcript_204:32-1924(+)
MTSRLLLFHSKSLTGTTRRNIVRSSSSPSLMLGKTEACTATATRSMATTTTTISVSSSSSSSSAAVLHNHHDSSSSFPLSSHGSFAVISSTFQLAFYQTKTTRSYSATSATTAEAAAAAAAATAVQPPSPSSDTESTSATSTEPPPKPETQMAQNMIVPTRHSIHLPVDVCTDPIELEEMTKSLLLHGQDYQYQYNDDVKALDRYRQKILYVIRGHSSNIPGTLYSEVAPTSTSASASASPVESVASSSISTIMDILINIEEQDQTHRELFQRKHRATPAAVIVHGDDSDTDDEDEEIEIGSTTFGEVDDMFSSIVEHKHQHEHELETQQDKYEDADFSAIENAMSKLGEDDDEGDFSNETVSERNSNVDEDNGIMTVMTVAMYETLLDALAGASQVMVDGSSNDSNNVDILHQNDVLNPSSILEMVKLTIEKGRSDDPVTIVTYNAAVRAMANLGRFYHQRHGGHSSPSFPQYRDEVLHAGLSVYNLLTHNPFGVKRNGQSVKYLLQTLEQTIPPSRVRGNMSVTLWQQASREGVVTPSLVECFLHNIHGVSAKKAMIDDMSLECTSINGPEFTAFSEKLLATLETRSSSTSSSSSNNSSNFDETYKISPARFARFAKKYAHSHPARLY